jgi:hypothetical protein
VFDFRERMEMEGKHPGNPFTELLTQRCSE